MPDHPKVVGLSHAAFRLYIESICWCGRQLTDGKVPAAAMRRMGGWSPAAIKELAAAGLFEMGEVAHWLIHDYTEHQRTADEVAQYRKAKKLAGTTGNHERWHLARGLRDPDCELCSVPDESRDGSHVRSHIASVDGREGGRKQHRKTSPETESDTKKEEVQKTNDPCGSDSDPEFSQFWAVYPRKIGKGQARKAWRAARLGRKVPADVIIATAERFRDATHLERTEQRFIPHPATWLNGERYDDGKGDDAPMGPVRISYPASPWAQ
jgi:hypothetical protein